MATDMVNLTEPSPNTSQEWDGFQESQDQLFESIQVFLISNVIGKICIFGIIGNMLNLIILSRKSLTTNMERLERGAHMGLMALAVSDLLFCISAYPHSWESKDEFQTFKDINFWLVYQIYGPVLINIFVLSSTWITVAMAISRYLAICFPLHSRQYLGVTSARRVLILVALFSIIFNIPRFFLWKIDNFSNGNETMYFKYIGPLSTKEVTLAVYNWLYFILGILIPLIALAFCNFFLIRALRESNRLHQQRTNMYQSTNSSKSVSSHSSSSSSATILTLTLCIIVVLYLLLVIPAECLTFIKEVIISDQYQLFTLSLVVCNTLQAINFSFNFILYCIINVKFRQTIHDILCCKGLRGKNNSRPFYSSVSIGTKTTNL